MLNQLAVLQVTVVSWLKARFFGEEDGASLVEYALLLALIAMVAVGALVLFGNSLSNSINNSANQISAP